MVSNNGIPVTAQWTEASHILCPFEAANWLSISSHDGCSHGATAAGSPAAAASGIGGASALADQALASASVYGLRTELKIVRQVHR